MQCEFKLSNDLENIIEKLNNAGFEAYIVGGCVRDTILGKNPQDWDICTSATPEQMMRVFASDRVIPTGLQHGTITVLPKGYAKGEDNISHDGYEITTFRADGEYSDGRHPDSVNFVTDVKEDLARRDFTINAMAYAPNTGIIDPFNGYEDLMNKQLRCVGKAEDRFSEDALRIMRALRFAANYGLSIQEDTSNAIRDLAFTLDKISKERITTELLKMFAKAEKPGELLSQYKEVLLAIISELKPCMGFDQKTPWHQFDILTHSLKTVDAIDQSIVSGKDLETARLTALLHDIGKPDCYKWDETKMVAHFKGHPFKSVEIAEHVLDNDLRVTSEMKKATLQLIERHENRRENMPKPKRLVNAIGFDMAKLLIEVQKADVIAHGNLSPEYNHKIDEEFQTLETAKSEIEEIENNKEAVSVKDLEIRGKDLIDMGIKPGPVIGEILSTILDKVMDNAIPNDRDTLLSAAKYIYDEISKEEERTKDNEEIEEQEKSEYEEGQEL